MENDIPALAYIEAQILGRAVASGSIGCHVTATEDEYGLARGSLGKGVFWETRVLSLLYTLILFPKEHWKMGPNDPVYAEIAENEALKDEYDTYYSRVEAIVALVLPVLFFSWSLSKWTLWVFALGVPVAIVLGVLTHCSYKRFDAHVRQLSSSTS